MSPGGPVSLKAVLDEEVGRLSRACRGVAVECLLSRRTAAQVAAALGLPSGAVGRRLVRATAVLWNRLLRRGFEPAEVAAFFARGF